LELDAIDGKRFQNGNAEFLKLFVNGEIYEIFLGCGEESNSNQRKT